MTRTLSCLSIASALLFLLSGSCKNSSSPNDQMTDLLADVHLRMQNSRNPFSPQAKMVYYDSSLQSNNPMTEAGAIQLQKAMAFLELGKEEDAISITKLVTDARSSDLMMKMTAKKNLALAYLRQGERTNCIHDHSSQSCIFPIASGGVHSDITGSSKAIELYREILSMNPNDLSSRWLLNIAYMTIGGYPADVPPDLLISGLDKDSSTTIKPFIDVAVNMGLNTKNQAGGSIIDDFNNDGYLDLITSSWDLEEPMHYCQNNADGSFTDLSKSSGLNKFTGGLNIMQTDYNNDGFKDIFVTRGGWKGKFGEEPNSLLRNNGDGTFTDVTVEMGLLSFHPTQTATWADFNNDGWLDLFIGNESRTQDEPHPCELYINQQGKKFKEMARDANCDILAFVKGVTSGDYNNDGYIDIFISTLNGDKKLLKNNAVTNGSIKFTDVSIQAGLSGNKTRTFPTWFWDFDNDGWLDILVCGYEFEKTLSYYAAAEALGMPQGNTGTLILYRNLHNGSFEEVSQQVGLNRTAFAMGSNFGDIDNDGFLDIYLGTGNPQYESLVPNKLFHNDAGRRFVDITTAARVGNLQKGHGVSFADIDNDGDQDIYIEMGGAYVGDAYQNSLFINPGQKVNNWIDISLEGIKTNRAAIGTKIKVTFKENGISRSVYREVNSGGSFGSNPLLQHIGIGHTAIVDSLEISWPGSKTVQVFRNLKTNESFFVKEGSPIVTKAKLKRNDFIDPSGKIVGCGPLK